MAPSKKALDGNPANPPKTLKCPDCLQEIPVGPGGENNLTKRHVGTEKCKANIRLAAEWAKHPPKKTPIYAPLTAFFFKPKEAVPSTVATPARVQGTPITPMSVPDDLPPAETLNGPTGWFSDLLHPLVVCEEAQDLLRQLKVKIAFIPSHAPLAEATHALACFSPDP
ncbi:hypothetical protein DFH09DRAFT_1483293, partial [Mycena vulgaris]